MADPQAREAHESPKLDHVRRMAISQEQQTRQTPLLGDAGVWFREKLNAVLRPVDPQPKPIIQDRLEGSAYKEVGQLETPNLLRATFELEETALGSLRKITKDREVNFVRVEMLPGYILECDLHGVEHRYDSYRFTPGKLQEVKILAFQFDERIQPEKSVETVQERVQWLGTEKVCVSTLLKHVDHISASRNIKEGLRIVLREHLGPDVLFPPIVIDKTMKWAVRLTDEWLQKTAKGGVGWLSWMVRGVVAILLFCIVKRLKRASNRED
ncbi:MAG: hypothetical protein Q9173_005759 [Seirophora scorigena]